MIQSRLKNVEFKEPQSKANIQSTSLNYGLNSYQTITDVKPYHLPKNTICRLLPRIEISFLELRQQLLKAHNINLLHSKAQISQLYWQRRQFLIFQIRTLIS